MLAGENDTRDADPGLAGDGNNLSDSTRITARQLDEDPIHRHHHGQRPFTPRKQAGHMNEPDPAQINASISPLPNRGRSLIAAPSSTSSLSPSGSWFSSRSASAAAASGPVGKARALQGPQRANVRSHAHGPYRAVAHTSPEATRTSDLCRMIWLCCGSDWLPPRRLTRAPHAV